MLKKLPYLVYADCKGKIYVHPYLKMCGQEGSSVRVPHAEELVCLPRGSTFYFLPQRHPVGFDPRQGTMEYPDAVDGRHAFAVSCFLVPTYIRLLLPAYWLRKKKSPRLPLWAYNSVGYYGGRFWAAAMRIDKKNRQLPHFYPEEDLRRRVKQTVRLFPKNRLAQHLAYCALHYSCLAAKNFFYSRWEAPLPASRFCNSGCLGCLSFQEEEGIASHRRIGFTPSPEELSEIALYHIEHAAEPVVSFGQGCEGEPLLAYTTIRNAIRLIRQKTSRGTINLNTNASKPDNLRPLIEEGLTSMRVSINSAQKQRYYRYFRPRGYSFADVLRSIKLARSRGIFVSINYLMYPGVTDTEKEFSALRRFIHATDINMIQLKNLNIDPEVVVSNRLVAQEKPIGIRNLLGRIRKQFPRVKISYFNIPREEFSAV